MSPAPARRAWLALAAVVALALALALPVRVSARAPLRELGGWDVIVVGSEPEGIASAVAAAEAGARTLLLSPDERLGGLFVLGELNALDLYDAARRNRGVFGRWHRRVGGGNAFDVLRAERAFEAMLAEAGVEVVLGAKALGPALASPAGPTPRVVGVRHGGVVLPAAQVIDATADMDLAAAAGARSSLGFASLGYDQRMADTLVFRIEGVDWAELRAAARERGRDWAVVDASTAYGHYGGVPKAYEPVERDLRLRGLNLGRQEDGSVLVNALLVHGIDPFDPASLAEGRARAEREARRVVAYLAESLPGFGAARYGGAAPALYVRETRHLEALCTLTVDDVLDQRTTALDVVLGGYPLDVQQLTPHDQGFVFGAPERFGARLCVSVPRHVDGLWVVGRAAGYDPIAASSARVVPFGMMLGEAVGLAAADAAREGLLPRVYATDEAAVADLRERLRARGAHLPDAPAAAPVGPASHPHYDAYRLLLSRGLALGGYDNDPRLDTRPPALSFVFLLANVAQRFHGADGAARGLVGRYANLHGEGGLEPRLALEIAVRLTCELAACPPATSWEGLAAAGVAPAGFAPSSSLTRGESYELAAGIARLARGGVRASE